MTFNKKNKIVIGILVALLVALLISNFVITRMISAKVVELLKNQHVENVQISIGATRFSLFDRSLVFKEFYLSPSDTALAKLKRNELDKNSLQKISISRIKLKGIHLTSLLLSRNLVINKLIIDNPLYQSFKNNRVDPKINEGKQFRLDSIRIKELNGFNLETIKVSNFKIQFIDIHENSISFENKPLDFEVTGMKLVEVSDHLFKVTPLNDSFTIRNLKIELPSIKYEFSIAELAYLYGDDYLKISDLKYKPLVNKLTLANSYTYNYDVYNLGVKEILVYHLNTAKLIQNKGVFMDSIRIKELSLEVYKDKRKPFDLKKRPRFPHEALKQMKTPLLIQKVSVENSNLTYEERLENKDILMKATMNELAANFFNVTSIEEYRKSPLKIDLNSKLMGKGNLNLDMILPLADGDDTFFFSGYLGKSRMKYYDTAIIPALGLKVLAGEIESLSFSASANSYTSNGTMEFVYHDLEAEVFKHKNTEKSGFLSWSVNNLIHKSNPRNNGELKEAVMNFERVEYKGFGNFLWKTIQSGIVNSIAPFGKTSDKVDAKKKRQTKREERRKKRQD